MRDIGGRDLQGGRLKRWWMAFDRLQTLGKEKFQKIVNELMRGTPSSYALPG